MKSLKSINPWLWVPTLYFLEGIPYFLVNNISMVMFNQMGVPNGEMSFFTTLLYFPWALKFLWAPFVDLIKTKRWWFITMQVVMLALAILTILAIPQPDAATIAAMGTEVRLFTGVLIAFIIMAFASATHDIAADGFYMLALTSGVQAEMIGFRSVFYRLSNVFCNSALIAIPGIIYDWTIEQGEANMPLAWKVTMVITAIIFAIMAVWHIFFTPRPDSDKPNAETTSKEIWSGFGKAFATYFKKPALWVAILFMLLYRLPEGFLMKMIYPFLLGTREMGGLGMSMQELGIVYGAIGVVFLLVGGLLGGYFISWIGLKKSFWWMALAMTLPCLSFVYLSECLPTSMISISIAIAIEQIGYGFGFTAYMMYMMYFSDGEFKTSHYAICTSFMALSMIIPGLFAGFIQEGSSPAQKTIEYNYHETARLSAPIGYDKSALHFNGWAVVSLDSAENFVEEMYVNYGEQIIVTENKNLYASFSAIEFVESDSTIDTIFTHIPLTELYSTEQLQTPVVTSNEYDTHTLQFMTAKGKMSDYRWFFWMVICCSAATFLVTFLARRITDPKYGKNPRNGLPADRDLLKMIILGPITLGIYPLIVFSKISKEINIVASKYDGKNTMHYLFTLLLSGIALGIVPLVWTHRITNRIGNELKRRGIDYKFSAKDFWLWCILGSILGALITAGIIFAVIYIVYSHKVCYNTDTLWWIVGPLTGVGFLIGPYTFIHKFLKAVNLMNAAYNEEQELANK